MNAFKSISAKAGFPYGAAIVFGALFGFACVFLGAEIGRYGLGMFVGIPFAAGFLASWLLLRTGERSFGACARVSFCTLLGMAFGLLLFGLEGMLCILMAFPLAGACALAGAAAAFGLQKLGRVRNPALGFVVLGAPLWMGAEAALDPPAPLYAVKTAIEVNAAPEKVWERVVSFSELPAPKELLFRAGIAYPIRAEIRGQGVGAVRHCIFSTGAFVEPMEVWDEPRLLRFSVTENPPSMRELSPYPDIHPPHVEGFLVSRRGQFLLTPLPGGRTRLEGTTWYQHHLWPAAYWRLWSDAILHRIHRRVLEHIAVLAEGDRGDEEPGLTPGLSI